ncbi:MAG: lysophospholipid acyltransferase family protein [Bernardetiaceae bacterium]
MMIEPRYHPLYARFWSWYFRTIIRSDFASFSVMDNIQTDPEHSILLLQNHISWWDGFWAYHLNDLYFGRRFHVMMLEEELAKRRFLTYAGAFSVQKNSRSIIQSLNFCAQLLRSPENLLLLFPQGKIESLQIPQLSFGKGVIRVLEQARAHTQVIYACALPDYFSDRKPHLRLYLKHIPNGELGQITDWMQDFNEFYTISKTRQLLHPEQENNQA